MTSHELSPELDNASTAESEAKKTRSGRVPRTRQARRHRRRIRHRVIAGVVVGVTLLAGVLVATDTLRTPAKDRPVLAADDGSTGGTNDATVEVQARALSATTPMRLWIAGDSLSYALGLALGDDTATTGVVKPVYDARVSSGLSSPQFFNWPEHAKKELTRLDPESVVFIIGANDLGVAGGDDWEATYGAKVDAMMDLLAGPNNERAVYWVGPPTFREKSRNEASRKINDLMRERAAMHPSVAFIDGFDAFADEKGKFAAKLSDDTGKLVTVRTDDGVHFTTAGGERLARIVFAVLDRTWRVTSQSVAGAIQEVEQTEGCCRTPSGSNNTQWRTATPVPRAPSSTPTTGKATTTTKAPSVSSSTTSSTTAAPSSTTTTTTTTSPGG